jgi:hypothetical protein
MRLAIALLVWLLLLPALARADARLEVHVGGGLEAGTVSNTAHPTAVGEVGLAGELLLPGRDWGFGLSFDTLARPDHDLTTYEEDKLDLMFRYAPRGRRFRVGFGAGVRWLMPDAVDGVRPPTVRGVDFARIDIGVRLGQVRVRDTVASIDGYFSWTFGCYLWSGSPKPMEIPMPVSTPSYTNAVSSSYTLGLQVALGSR